MSVEGVLLVIAAAVGFSAALTGSIFWLVARVTAKALARLEAEGIERRSGPRWIRTTLRGYRDGARMAGYRVSVNRGEAVLVREAFVVVAGVLVLRFAKGDLGAARVWLEDGALCFTSDRPTGASGQVEVKVTLPDPEGWRDALLAKGAKPREG